jgi:hypothetical protein
MHRDLVAMVKPVIVIVLLLGNSQIAGQMGVLLEQHYRNHNVSVVREAASGKGVKYFLLATASTPMGEESIVGYKQRKSIRNMLSNGVDYVIFGSLGGNDAFKGCCYGKARSDMVKMYRKLFNQLCSYGATVIFNGSPPAHTERHRKFDRRRAALDAIQDEAAHGTCVIRNSVRDLHIPPDPDGYHYNMSARLYVDHLMTLPGMELPIIEASQ